MERFAVDGPVRVLEMVEEKLLIGGHFSMTAPLADSSLVDQVQVDNVTYWVENEFIEIAGRDFNEILAAGYVQGELFLVDSLYDADFESDVTRVHRFDENVWQERIMSDFFTIDGTVGVGKVSGFVGDGETVYIYGEIMDLYSLIGQTGFVDLNGDKGVGFDAVVRAAVVFQDRVYFGGDFTRPEGDGLVSAAVETGGGDATQDLELTQTFEVSAYDGKLHVSYKALDEDSVFSLYDYNGKIIDSFSLQKGESRITKSYAALKEGFCVYQIQKGNRMTAGKLSFF